MIVEIARAFVVAALVDVNHHLQDIVISDCPARSSDAGPDQSCEIRPILPMVSIDLTKRPQHSISHLISNLDHIDRGALGGKGGNHMLCIVHYRSRQAR